MSLTTTVAPCRANSSACARPMPRPAPVTMTTRPSQIMAGDRRRLGLCEDSPACATASPCSPPTSRSASSTSRRPSRSAGSTRSGCPSTPTSRRAGARRHPTGDASCPRSTSAASTRSSRWPRPQAAHPAPPRHRHRFSPRSASRSSTAKAAGHARPQSPAAGFALGIGFGWNEDEMDDHGVDYAHPPRARPASTCSRCARCGATTRPPSTASYVQFSPSWSWPKPVQRSGPPILDRWRAPDRRCSQHIAEYADGWIPIGGRGPHERAPPAACRPSRDAGRDPDELEIVPFGSIPDPGKLDHYRVDRRHRVRVPTPVGARR